MHNVRAYTFWRNSDGNVYQIKVEFYQTFLQRLFRKLATEKNFVNSCGVWYRSHSSITNAPVSYNELNLIHTLLRHDELSK